MQHQRFERKYFITDRQALEIRAWLKSRLVPDENSEGRPDNSYAVHSLYVDSHQLMTYWATVHCEKKRFKLRVRYYDDNPESPLFFEIKRRENECVMKQRGVVHRRSGALLLAGQLPTPSDLVSSKPSHLAALQRFCHFMQRMEAQPTVHVGYMREAWVSATGNSIRATIDRHVRGQVRHEPVFTTQMPDPIYPFGDRPILELKFTDRFPGWFQDLVHHFNLTQCGVPKYCGSVAEATEERVSKFGLLGRDENIQEKLAQVVRYC